METSDAPSDGKGIPSNHEYLGESKSGRPMFRGPDGKQYSRSVRGDLIENAGNVRAPSAGESIVRAKQAEKDVQAKADAATQADAAAKSAAETHARRDAEYAARDSAVAAMKQAESDAARSKAADRDHRQGNANHLDFHTNQSDPHRVDSGVPEGSVRITAGPTDLGRQSLGNKKKGETQWKSGYVAKVNGVGGQYGLDRTFVTQKGGGSPVSADVGDGVYEVGTGAGKGETAQHYVHVADGKPRVIEASEAEDIVGDTPAEASRKAGLASDLARPAVGPAVDHTHTDPGKPFVGQVVMRGDVPHRIESIGRSVYRSAEDYDDMDDFGRPAGWETATKAVPLAWRDGDPETGPQKTARKTAESQAREPARLAGQVLRDHFEANGEWSESVPEDLFTAGEQFGRKGYDAPGYHLHPDGNLYSSRYNNRDGDDWRHNNHQSSHAVSRAPATPEAVAALRTAFNQPRPTAARGSNS